MRELAIQTGIGNPSDELIKQAFDNGLTLDELRHRVRIMQNVEMDSWLS